MARIFTVEFEWEGMLYHALVSMLYDTEKVKYAVKLEEGLEHISNGGVITIDLEELERAPIQPPLEYLALVQSLETAISKHLNNSRSGFLT